jgi:hypothetical protein
MGRAHAAASGPHKKKSAARAVGLGAKIQEDDETSFFSEAVLTQF